MISVHRDDIAICDYGTGPWTSGR